MFGIEKLKERVTKLDCEVEQLLIKVDLMNETMIEQAKTIKELERAVEFLVKDKANEEIQKAKLEVTRSKELLMEALKSFSSSENQRNNQGNCKCQQNKNSKKRGTKNA